MAPRKIILCQLGWAYDTSIYLPVSIGMLAAHARSNEEFNRLFEIDPWLRFDRDHPDRLVDGFAGEPAIVGLSCYVWSTALSLAVAARVKQRWPRCVVVLGGPSVSDDAEQFLRANPAVDVAVHGEGEQTFLELCLAEGREHESWRAPTTLQTGMTGLDDASPSRGAVPGTSFLDRNGDFVKGPIRTRRKELDSFASPFLAGVFEDVLKRPYEFQAVWECARGCPYSCSFCAWGSNINAKIARFSDERLEGELAWFADNRIEHIYCADANFGILPRDLPLARKIAALKRSRGYPKSFFVNYPKNSSTKIFEVARLLHEEGLCKGATLSFQSHDEQVLSNVQRDNIDMATYQKLQKLYRGAGVPSYSELIMGLPGESIATFTAGIEATIDAGEHDAIFIYPCRLLPNTSMSKPEYIEKFGIVTRPIPIQANHADLAAPDDPVSEFEDIVTATAAMPTADWLECNRISWFVAAFFCMKLAYFPLVALQQAHGVRVTDFARWFLTWARDPKRTPLLAREMRRVDSFLQSVLAGVPSVPRDGIEEFLQIRWPLEEASFLALIGNPEELECELRMAVDAYLADQSLAVPEWLDEVFVYQRALLVRPTGPALEYATFRFSVPQFFAAARRLEPTGPLERRDQRISVAVQPGKTFTSADDFAKRQVWWSRRGGSFLYDAAWEDVASPEAGVRV